MEEFICVGKAWEGNQIQRLVQGRIEDIKQLEKQKPLLKELEVV
jgi:hypothetical protein